MAMDMKQGQHFPYMWYGWFLICVPSLEKVSSTHVYRYGNWGSRKSGHLSTTGHISTAIQTGILTTPKPGHLYYRGSPALSITRRVINMWAEDKASSFNLISQLFRNPRLNNLISQGPSFTIPWDLEREMPAKVFDEQKTFYEGILRTNHCKF